MILSSAWLRLIPFPSQMQFHFSSIVSQSHGRKMYFSALTANVSQLNALHKHEGSYGGVEEEEEEEVELDEIDEVEGFCHNLLYIFGCVLCFIVCDFDFFSLHFRAPFLLHFFALLRGNPRFLLSLKPRD